MTELDILHICVIVLMVTKIPDFVTTWQSLKKLPHSTEKNPMARWLFEKVGIKQAFIILAIVYTAMVGLVYPMYFWTPDYLKGLSVYSMIPFTLFMAIVHIQVALYNISGKMHFPLNAVYSRLRWFYR